MGTSQTAALAWAGFPLALLAISLGIGVLLETAAGARIPRPLLVPFGFAAFVVVGQSTTAWHASAVFTMPLAAGLAVLGWFVGWRRILTWNSRTVAGAVAAASTYVAHLLPVLMTGTPTFAGWIKLDDGATWLAFADRMIEAGRTVSGLAPSTYEAVLDINLMSGTAGYPVGAFVPLGGVARLLGIDPAWTLQPYMAFLAAVTALVVFHLLARHIRSLALRAVTALTSACAALFYGYALWGGVKELALAPLVALTVWALCGQLPRLAGWRELAPAAVALSATLAVAGPSGLVWVLPASLVAMFLLLRQRDARVAASRIAVLAVLTLATSVPALLLIRPAGINGLAKFASSSSDIGNLWGPLRFAQIGGIWPVGDFRAVPEEYGPVMVAVALVALLALAGAVQSVRRQAPELAVLVGSVAAIALLFSFGNAWIGGKALAMSSPLVLAAAFAGIGWLLRSHRTVEGLCAVLLVTGGVLWSDALQYREAWLAPYDQLHELEIIGKLPELRAPALYTDTTVYGARHFLRHLDAEGASDLRRNVIPLRNGAGLDKGQFADIDAFALNSVEAYRTLVVRRSGLASRPPSDYRLVWQGSYYEAWQRGSDTSNVVTHLPLGGADDPAAMPDCAAVADLARTGVRIAYVERAPVVTVPLPVSNLPPGWYPSSAAGWLVMPNAGSMDIPMQVTTAGDYSVWLSGSFRGSMELLVDGVSVLQAQHWLNLAGTQLPGDRVTLAAGSHTVTLRYSVSPYLPGAAGSAFALGPIAFAPSTADLPVSMVPADQAATLCGRSLDWVEALAN